jgi:MftR C-terminal domain
VDASSERPTVSVPEVRARFLEEQTNGVAALATLFARQRGSHLNALRLRVMDSSLLAAVFVALDRWQQDPGKNDLLALLDQATDALAEGMRELRPSPPARAETT